MKKFFKILAIVVVVGIALFGAWWAYVVSQYKQHLPLHELVVNGVEREYHLYVPAEQADQPRKLLILLQGGDAGSWRFPQQFQWEALAEEQGVIIAVPVGKRVPPNEGAWQLNTGPDTMQDIHFFDAMINELLELHDVDRARIYAVGYSLGSMFGYELMCQMSSRFAAIASHAGTMPISPQACEPARHVPFMHLHGVDDPIIAYGNTWDWKAWDSVGTMYDVPGLLQHWRQRFDCQTETEKAFGAGVHMVNEACAQGARIEHYRFEELGHDWPESIEGVSTHRVIWSFLDLFSLP